jgi:hypothetical protein
MCQVAGLYTVLVNFRERLTGEFQALPSSTLGCRLRLAGHGTSTQAFYEIGGNVTTMPSRSLTPLLLKKSTTLGPSSALPASMRYSSPPACTRTPSPCPTSMKLTESEPEGGEETPPVAPGTRPQAGTRRSRQSSSATASKPLRNATLRPATPVGRRDALFMMRRTSSTLR